MSDTKPFRVILWCVPRSISTAISKCFSFVDNTQIWFEPYCYAFFYEFQMKAMGMEVPRKKEDLKLEEVFARLASMTKGSPAEALFTPDNMDTTLFLHDSIRTELDAAPADRAHFVKDMAYAITGHLDLLPSKESGYKHTFLIRDPERMFPSWRNLLMIQMEHMPMPGSLNVKCDPATFDITTDVPFMMPGYTYKCQYDLWKHVKENLGDPEPVVIDIDELLAHPDTVLPKYFKACGMKWDEKYLQWDASSQVVRSWRCLTPSLGTSAHAVIESVHKVAFSSTGFCASKPKIARSEMTPDVIKAIDATADFYKEMAARRIMP